ncbi:alpha/beta hydrolase [Granulicella arctica]|uniref:alpha/beta hydrolase n=1 Tax=Granulicella arctica TaxID=940613 RepID=UPI0021DF426C|nr:lysophospholipase [Granulicella arctica]
MLLRKLLLSSALLFVPSLYAQQLAAISDDPALDKAAPAAMQSIQIPSHGALLNGLVYIAAGSGPHPVVLLLHGFPGNERNLDLAQTIRRAGWDVLFFDYRGSWGTPGDFSFTHSIEDTHAALAYLRDPANAAKFHADPKYLVLIGHSMGGMIAANVGATDPAVKAIGLISAADMAGFALPAVLAGKQEEAVGPIGKKLAAEGIAPLAGCTPESLARDLIAHAKEWSLANQALKLASRPILVVTSDDGLAPSNDVLVMGLEKAGDKQVTAIHIATDHSYSDRRIALETAVLDSLSHLKPQ